MATRKILFRGQTRRKGEKTSISGKPLPGIWVTGGIFPQNKGYERAIIYTQDPKVEKHVVYAETVGQYTGVDDVLETPVFEDDIITFWQRTDTKHLQRYKGIVKYDEALTSFTVVSCEPNRLSDPLFLWDCSDIHVVGNTFDGELSKREQEVSCTYAKCLALAKDIDTLQLCYGPRFSALRVDSLWSKAFELMDDVTRSRIIEDLKFLQKEWRGYEEKPVKDAQEILDAIGFKMQQGLNSKAMKCKVCCKQFDAERIKNDLPKEGKSPAR